MKKTLAVFLSAALTASSLLGGTAASVAAEADTTFTVALSGDIVALDPIYAYDYTTNLVVIQITQPLLQFDENNELQPCLCSSWEAADDTTYVYQIRDDVTFSDGSPMTMDDVLFSLERNLDPEAGSYLNWLFSKVDSIEQTGDWELTVHLKEPSATWNYTMATTAAHVISKAYYEEHELDFGTPDGGLMGTGPYVFDSWTSGQEIVLTRNENYWDPDNAGYLDTIEYKIIQDDTTRVNALTNGDIDFTCNTPTDMLDTLNAADNITVTDINSSQVTFLAFNTQRAPFDDVNVRKAITAAIDLHAIAENIVKDGGKEGTCMPNSDSLFVSDPDFWNSYIEENPVVYDVEAAKAYLAESGYPDGFDCVLYTSENSMRYAIALYIQAALADLGINVDLQKLGEDEHTAYQFGEYFDEDGNRDYDMIMAGWEADYPDISSNIEVLFAGYNAGEGGSNTAVFTNDEVDELLAKGSASMDETERNEIYAQVMDIANENVPYVFLMYPLRACVMSNDYTGLRMNSSWNWNMFFNEITPAE
ncbi:MAG: ABC transporter substrate-binding protein [Eubacterium sp.]|nr:ABC transporter substrate-binding protein [Eubacterium sp.]